MCKTSLLTAMRGARLDCGVLAAVLVHIWSTCPCLLRDASSSRHTTDIVMCSGDRVGLPSSALHEELTSFTVLLTRSVIDHTTIDDFLGVCGQKRSRIGLQGRMPSCTSQVSSWPPSPHSAQYCEDSNALSEGDFAAGFVPRYQSCVACIRVFSSLC